MKIYITLTIMALLLTTSIIMGGINEHKDENSGHFKNGKVDVAPVNNSLYQEECGSCHFAYQAGLLPAESWSNLMASLEDHFGENAELDQKTQQELTKYLNDNAADYSNYKRSKQIMSSLKNSKKPLLRITETLFFVRKHDEIPYSIVRDTPELGSYSKCSACHRYADTGSYNENNIIIPGIGRWED